MSEYNQAYLDAYGSAKEPDANCTYADAVNIANLLATVGIPGTLGISMSGAQGPVVLGTVPLTEITPVSPWNVEPTASRRYNYCLITQGLEVEGDIQVRCLGFILVPLEAKDPLGRYVYSPYDIAMSEWAQYTRKPANEWTPMDYPQTEAKVIAAVNASYPRPEPPQV